MSKSPFAIKELNLDLTKKEAEFLSKALVASAIGMTVEEYDTFLLDIAVGAIGGIKAKGVKPPVVPGKPPVAPKKPAPPKVTVVGTGTRTVHFKGFKIIQDNSSLHKLIQTYIS